MGILGFLSILILSCTVSSWTDSTVLGIVFFIGSQFVLTPAERPGRTGRQRGVPLWSVALCLVGVAWWAGAADE